MDRNWLSRYRDVVNDVEKTGSALHQGHYVVVQEPCFHPNIILNSDVDFHIPDLSNGDVGQISWKFRI